MRILICDDDILVIEQLEGYIKVFFEKISVKCPKIVCFSDGESLLADKGDKDRNSKFNTVRAQIFYQ